MSTFFRPYEGKAPYLFVSYSHADSDRVLELITALHKRRYRVWYDEGIDAGMEWPETIQQHIRRAALMLVFISKTAIASPNCSREVALAKKLALPMLYVRLDDDVAAEAPWADIPLADTVPYHSFSSGADAAGEIIGANRLPKKLIGDGRTGYGASFSADTVSFWTLLSIVSALLLLLAGVGALGLSRGWFAAYLPQEALAIIATPAPSATPAPTSTPVQTVDLRGSAVLTDILSEAAGKYVDFTCDLEERAIRRATGIAEGRLSESDLLAVTELHLCGGTILRSREGIAVESGNVTVNGAPVLAGTLSNLTNIGKMQALTELTLASEGISSLSNITDLQRLTYLNVSNNPLSRWPVEANLLSLAEIDLSRTEVADLTPLNTLPSLQKVYLNADMFPVTTDPATQRYEIVLVP